MTEKLQLAKLSFNQLNRVERRQFLADVSPDTGKTPAPATTGPAKIIRFGIGAERFGYKCTKSFMRVIESAGIKKITLPGHKRASGILESDLVRLVGGEA